MGVGQLTLARGEVSWSYSLAIPETPMTIDDADGAVISEIRQSWIIRPGDIDDYIAPAQGDVLTYAGKTYRVPTDAAEDYDPAGVSVRVRGVQA